MGFNTQAHEITRRNPIGIVGMCVMLAYANARLDAVCSGDQAKQVTTVTVDTADNSTAYTMTINGIAVSYTSDSSATKVEIAAGLAAAVNGTPSVRGQVVAASDGVDAVTLTSVYPGVAFTFAESDANLSSAATTASAAASTVAPGKGIAITGTAGSSVDSRLLEGCVASDSALSAQVDTHVVTNEASKVVLAEISFRGQSYAVEVASGGSATSTASAVRDAINGRMPADTVLAASSGGTLTLTSEIVGEPFESRVEYTDNASTGSVAKTSTAGLLTDANRAVKGVVERRTDTEGSTYSANEMFPLVSDGIMLVEDTQGVAFGDRVYIELDATSDDVGKFFNAASSTRAWLRDWSWGVAHTAEQLAELHVKGGR